MCGKEEDLLKVPMRTLEHCVHQIPILESEVSLDLGCIAKALGIG